MSALYTDTYTETHRQTCAHNTPTSVTVTHTQQFNVPLIRDNPGEPIPEETFTHSHPWGRRRKIRTDNKVHGVEVHPLYGALSQRGLLDAIKPAYNQSLLDGRLKLTASAFYWLWISMPTVLLTVPTVTQNTRQPLSTSSITAHHLECLQCFDAVGRVAGRASGL